MSRNNISYLERLFIQSLNEEGDVCIFGVRFSRDYILYELDRDAYNDIFEDWKNERKENNLAEANRILDLFDNKRRFERLQGLFRKNKVIPFIGAGLSFQSGFPLWKDFLVNTQRETSSDTEKFNQLLENDLYEEAAQLLQNHSSSHLQEQLENHFGRKICFDDIYGTVFKLPEVFPESTVITTNYDDILKIVYENHQLHFEHYLNGIVASDFSKLVSDGERVLLKIHGTCTSSQNRILTEEDYRKHYNENNKIQSCIEKMASSPLLFLGCSLGNDRYILALKELVKNKGSDNIARHYAFLKRPDTDEERIKKKEHLQEANIFPIWYDSEHDEAIEALLELLAE